MPIEFRRMPSFGALAASWSKWLATRSTVSRTAVRRVRVLGIAGAGFVGQHVTSQVGVAQRGRGRVFPLGLGAIRGAAEEHQHDDQRDRNQGEDRDDPTPWLGTAATRRGNRRNGRCRRRARVVVAGSVVVVVGSVVVVGNSVVLEATAVVTTVVGASAVVAGGDVVTCVGRCTFLAAAADATDRNDRKHGDDEQDHYPGTPHGSNHDTVPPGEKAG